jgi:hypothetical protein
MIPGVMLHLRDGPQYACGEGSSESLEVIKFPQLYVNHHGNCATVAACFAFNQIAYMR